MKFIVLGAAGRMGSLHAKHLGELGHKVAVVDPVIDRAGMDVWPAFPADGIVIATPADQHAADINTVLAAGQVKHIFVEKPICLVKQLPGMRKMALDAKMSDVSIHVGYNLRFHPAVQGLMSARREGKMQSVIHGSLILRQVPKWPLRHFREEWASHEVDLALYLFGRSGIRSIGMEWKPEAPEWQCTIRHSFATSSIYVDGYCHRNVRSVTVVDQLGHCFHRDIEADHVRDEHYLAEIKAWVSRIENPGDIGPGDALATAADGVAAVNVFNWSSNL